MQVLWQGGTPQTISTQDGLKSVVSKFIYSTKQTWLNNQSSKWFKCKVGHSFKIVYVVFYFQQRSKLYLIITVASHKAMGFLAGFCQNYFQMPGAGQVFYSFSSVHSKPFFSSRLCVVCYLLLAMYVVLIYVHSVIMVI